MLSFACCGAALFSFLEFGQFVVQFIFDLGGFCGGRTLELDTGHLVTLETGEAIAELNFKADPVVKFLIGRTYLSRNLRDVS